MNDIKGLKSRKKRFRFLLFASYIIFAAIVITFVIMLHIHYSKTSLLKSFESEAMSHSKHKIAYLENIYNATTDTILSIANNPYFQDFIKKDENKRYIQELFKTIMSSNANYMQLRFINEFGQEIIRVDRDEIGSKVKVIPKQMLQNKSKRYYYKECCLIPKGSIWFSKIDLNVERGEVEIPFKPVVRVAYPLYESEKFKGFIMVNLFMKKYLKFLSTSPIHDIFIIDSDGYFISHPNSEYSWSKYTNKLNVIEYFPDCYKQIVGSKSSHLIADCELFVNPVHLNTTQNLTLIYKLKESKIISKQNSFNQRTAITLLLVILVAIPFAYIISHPLNRMYEELQKQKTEVEKLASNLEEEIKKKIEEASFKDRMLQHQSKLAALGEMIGNIAHQWRHPITRLSLIVQNIKNYKNAGKLSDEMLESYISSALEQIDYMSDTIEDFRTFYKPDKKSTYFKPLSSIESAIKIVSGSIGHKGIDFEIIKESDFMIEGYPNQFSQVILNILQNAKDVLQERQVESPKIKIRLYKKDGKKFIEIEDNGGGIKDDNIKKIFEPYYTTKNEEGTGIGLYMSKRIIEDRFAGSLMAKNSQNGAVMILIFET
jgi:signal transduction histidine kinase